MGADVADTSREGALDVHMNASAVTLSRRRQAHPRLWDAARRTGDDRWRCGDIAAGRG